MAKVFLVLLYVTAILAGCTNTQEAASVPVNTQPPYVTPTNCKRLADAYFSLGSAWVYFLDSAGIHSFYTDKEIGRKIQPIYAALERLVYDEELGCYAEEGPDGYPLLP